MVEFLAILKWPFVALFALACAQDEGVDVRVNIKGEPRSAKVNLVCEKPDLRMPVFEGEKKER